MSLPVGARKCCSVVEMTVDGFHNLNQFGNQARYLGVTFFRWGGRGLRGGVDRFMVVRSDLVVRLTLLCLCDTLVHTRGRLVIASALRATVDGHCGCMALSATPWRSVVKGLANDLFRRLRWESRDASKTTGEGTHVDVEAIKKLVTQALVRLPPNPLASLCVGCFTT
jgi:hypothetical protein